jgi:hypothetical protein
MLTELQRQDIIAFKGYKSAQETAELMPFPVSERTVQRVWKDAPKQEPSDRTLRTRDSVAVHQMSAKPDKSGDNTDAVPLVGRYSISADYTVEMMFNRIKDTKEQYEAAKIRVELNPNDQGASYRAVQYNRQLIEMMNAMAKWIGIDKGILTTSDNNERQNIEVKWI